MVERSEGRQTCADAAFRAGAEAMRDAAVLAAERYVDGQRQIAADKRENAPCSASEHDTMAYGGQQLVLVLRALPLPEVSRG